jgi:hypothetical protein
MKAEVVVSARQSLNTLQERRLAAVEDVATRSVNWTCKVDCMNLAVTESRPDGFFLFKWGHLKKRVYTALSRTPGHLLTNLQAVQTAGDGAFEKMPSVTLPSSLTQAVDASRFYKVSTDTLRHLTVTCKYKTKRHRT